MPYFSGLKILIHNDQRMTHPPEQVYLPQSLPLLTAL